jgi:GNAT superfamily N-acetyltransferase
MFQLPGRVLNPAIKALFDLNQPAALRCMGVLDGELPGRVFTDNPEHPTWVVMQEQVFGTLYLGGEPDATTVHGLIDDLRADGEVMIGFWLDDSHTSTLLPQPEYEGSVLDYNDRPRGEGLDVLADVPEGCELRRVDRALFERLTDRDFTLRVFGSAEAALEKGIGLCLMRGDLLVCETFAGPPIRGKIEVGVSTHPDYRGRDYATFTCNRLVEACEAMGYDTYWNCNAQNTPSVKLARKLGYRREQPYRLWWWSHKG